MPRTTIRAVALSLLLVAAACGGDDDTDDAATEDTATEDTATEDTATEDTAVEEGEDGADLEGYCDASFDLDQQFAAVEDFTPEVFAALRPDIDAALAIAPAEISDDLDTIVAAFEAIAETGDFAAFETPEVTAANDTVHGFEVDSCGFERIDVTATDFAFDATFPTEPGRYSLDATNAGDEAHVALLARLKDGQEGTAEEAFAAIAEEADPEAAFNEVFDEAIGPFVTPGASDFNYVELDAGEYILFCPVPFGSTEAAGFEGAGPPHFTQGMVAFFEVG